VTVGAPSATAAHLADDLAPKIIGTTRVALRADGAVVAGQEARFVFRLEEARTGQGITDLQPFLGEPAHAVILDEQAGAFVHTHGEPVGGSGEAHGAPAGATFGPEIAIHHTFPTPGRYKVWGQLKAGDGQVITADFVVRVQ
jgi:Cu+-exporting ATPase